MLDFAGERLARRGLTARLEAGELESFATRGRFDLAHCLVSTFKYVLDEAGARGHLRSVAATLAPGGVYVLGLHLTDYGLERPVSERWVVEEGGKRVVCNTRTWPADRRRRRERMRTRMVVTESGRERRSETNWWFRTYDARQLARLLRSAPELELVAVHDFHYDLEWTVPLAEARDDCVLVLRRRA